MGSFCESKQNQYNQNEHTNSNQNNYNEVNEPNELEKINEIIRKTEKTEIIEECIIKISPNFEKVDPTFTNVSKSICKLRIEIRRESQTERKVGTGFLLKIWNVEDYFYCLMSNEHVISRDAIKNKSIINISYDIEYKKRDIQLDEKKRYIQSFRNIGLDLTIVEIKDSDKIYKDYFLEPELDFNTNTIINRQIYIPQYPGGKQLKNARGKITQINQYGFAHLANTIEGSSGSPIFLENKIRVIGIHKGSDRKGTRNYADFIYPAINVVKNDLSTKRNNGKYVNGKYIWEDGKYYLGQCKNGLPHGKGKNMMQMEKYYMKVILLKVNMKEMESFFLFMMTKLNII